MNETRLPTRRWSQFTIQSFLLVTALAGVVIAWSLDHARLTSKLRTAEEDAAAQARDADEKYKDLLVLYEWSKPYAKLIDEERRLVRLIDVDQEQGRNAFQAVRGMIPFGSAERRELRMGLTLYEVVLIHNTALTNKDGDSTVALLMQYDRLVDSVVRHDSFMDERHKSSLQDINNDRKIDLVISSWPHGAPEASAMTEVYEITEQGFVKQD